MRRLIWIAPLALAACGGGETATENKAEAPATALQPGLYEVRSEVTAFNPADQATPQIAAQVGSTETETVCVPEGDRAPAELFAGSGYSCDFGNYYARKGRLNHTLDCTREGLNGTIASRIDGTFQADSFEANRELATYLSGDGDVEITTSLAGRRVGECPAADAPAEGEQ